MARKGVGFFDRRGQFFKKPEEATVSDLSAMLGKIGEGDSLAPGIALMLLEKRDEIEKIFAEHDIMDQETSADNVAQIGKIAVLPVGKGTDHEKAS